MSYRLKKLVTYTHQLLKVAKSMNSEGNEKDLQQLILTLNREPFRIALAELMHCRPDLESIQKLANKAPDRFYKAVATAARLSGYVDTTVVEHNYLLGIQKMSDADLTHALTQALVKLREPPVKPLPALEHEKVTESSKGDCVG